MTCTRTCRHPAELSGMHRHQLLTNHPKPGGLGKMSTCLASSHGHPSKWAVNSAKPVADRLQAGSQDFGSWMGIPHPTSKPCRTLVDTTIQAWVWTHPDMLIIALHLNTTHSKAGMRVKPVLVHGHYACTEVCRAEHSSPQSPLRRHV